MPPCRLPLAECPVGSIRNEACLMPYAKCFITLCFNKQHKQLPCLAPDYCIEWRVQQASKQVRAGTRERGVVRRECLSHSCLSGDSLCSLVLHLTGRALNCRQRRLAPLRYFLAICCITYTPRWQTVVITRTPICIPQLRRGGVHVLCHC